jgi:Uma2 family endonuclease
VAGVAGTTRRPRRAWSLAEFLRLPETKPWTELIDGRRHRKPVGTFAHSGAQGDLAMMLETNGRPLGGRAFVSLGFKFPLTTLGNLRVPDVSYYAPGSFDIDNEDDYPEVAPDLAAEVRSKGQSFRTLRERLAFLREQGTACTLLIDPEARTVEIHDGDRRWTATELGEVTLEALNGFSFKVAELFA